MQFYLYINDQVTGPYTVNVLNELYMLGRISGDTLAHPVAGDATWKPLRTFLKHMSHTSRLPRVPTAHPSRMPTARRGVSRKTARSSGLAGVFAGAFVLFCYLFSNGRPDFHKLALNNPGLLFAAGAGIFLFGTALFVLNSRESD